MTSQMVTSVTVKCHNGDQNEKFLHYDSYVTVT